MLKVSEKLTEGFSSLEYKPLYLNRLVCGFYWCWSKVSTLLGKKYGTVLKYTRVLTDRLCVPQIYEEAESILSMSSQKPPSPRSDTWITLSLLWSLTLNSALCVTSRPVREDVLRTLLTANLHHIQPHQQLSTREGKQRLWDDYHHTERSSGMWWFQLRLVFLTHMAPSPSCPPAGTQHTKKKKKTLSFSQSGSWLDTKDDVPTHFLYFWYNTEHLLILRKDSFVVDGDWSDVCTWLEDINQMEWSQTIIRVLLLIFFNQVILATFSTNADTRWVKTLCESREGSSCCIY